MKKGISKIFLSVLMLCLTLNMISIGNVSAVSGGKISLGTDSGRKGDMVAVPVNITTSSGIISLAIDIDYDDTKLELQEVSNSGILPGAEHSDNHSSPYRLSWANDLATEDYTPNGTLVNLGFKILSDEENEEVSVTVSSYEAVNAEMDDVSFSTGGGSVTIKNPKPKASNKSTKSTSAKSSSRSSTSRKTSVTSSRTNNKTVTSDAKKTANKKSKVKKATKKAKKKSQKHNTTETTLPTNENTPNNNGGLIWVIIVVSLVVLAGGGFAVYYFVIRKKK